MSEVKVKFELHDRMFSEENMYRFVENAAKTENLSQTAEALPLVKMYHAGQKRAGKDKVPYISHPLMMACHAHALGIGQDDILATIMYHDVCEDCDVKLEDLPVNDVVREAVDCLTFRKREDETREEAKKRYYDRIAGNKIAAIVKIIDRCNNVSTMATGFSKERMAKYICETEEYVIPLINIVKHQYREWYNVSYLLKYQILSVLESLKRTIEL